MSDPVLTVRSLTKRFGGFVALQKVDVHVNAGERLGLIGPNGSGKTTLINCISGALFNDEGTIAFEGRDITRMAPHRRARLGVARSFQIPKPFRSMSVLENLRVPLEYAAWSRAEHRRITDEAMDVLEQIGLEGRGHDNSAGLTQVDMRKLELARALATKPALLLLDEVMEGLTPAEERDAVALLGRIHAQGITLLLIEHVMSTVRDLSDRVIVMDYGKKLAEGTYAAISRDPKVVAAYLGTEE